MSKINYVESRSFSATFEEGESIEIKLFVSDFTGPSALAPIGPKAKIITRVIGNVEDEESEDSFNVVTKEITDYVDTVEIATEVFKKLVAENI